MKYIQVRWIHDAVDDPVTIYAELDDDLWDQRKIEIFRDARVGYADHNEEVGGTILGIEPWPDLKMLGAEPEFQIEEIDKSVFEQLWITRE